MSKLNATRFLLLAVTLIIAAIGSCQARAEVFRSRLLIRESPCHVRHFAEQIVVEKVVENYPAYQYYVGQELRDDAVAEKAALKLLRTQYQIELQALQSGDVEALKRFFPRGNRPGIPGSTSPTPSDPTEPEPPSPPAVAPTAGTVSKIFKANCIKCHGPTNPKGGLDLSNPDTLTELQRWKSFGLVVSGAMPKNAKPLSDTDAQAIMDWVQNK